MRLLLACLCGCAGLGAWASVAGEPAAPTVWTENFEQAKTANKDGRVLLLYFTGSDWCDWCTKLDQDVFAQKEFQDWAKKKVILVQLDYPRKKAQTERLREQNILLQVVHEITEFPTVVFLDKGGNELGKLKYQSGGPTDWIKAAEKIIAKAKK